MSIPVTLTVSSVDFSPMLTDYSVTHEITYEQIITTQDGTEHLIGARNRPIIEFSLMLHEDRIQDVYNALTARPLVVAFSDPDLGWQNKYFRLDSNLERAFAVRNTVSRKNYFATGKIRLRCEVTV